MKKDYNISERVFEEREKLSQRRTTIQEPSFLTTSQHGIADESEPLSKKLKIELKDIRRTELSNRNKESCDTKTKSAICNVKSPTINELGASRQPSMILEEVEVKTEKKNKTSLASPKNTKSQPCKSFINLYYIIYIYIFTKSDQHKMFTTFVIFLLGKPSNTTRENVRAHNFTKDQIHADDPGVITNPTDMPASKANEVSRIVQLPTVPLPIFGNATAALMENSLTSESLSRRSESLKSNDDRTLKTSETVTITTSTKTLDTSEDLQQTDVPIRSMLPNATVLMGNVPAERTNMSSSASSGAISISPSPLHSNPAQDDQSALEGTGSIISLSSGIHFSSSVAPSSPASFKTTTSSMRPTSHPSATFSMSSRSPSPAYSNPNSVTSSQDVILSEPGCGSGRPSVDSPVISATYSDLGAPSEGNDVSDGLSQTSSVDQELKEEIIQSTKSEPTSVISGASIKSTTSATEVHMARDLGLKIPVSEIDPSILPKTFIKGKVSSAVTTYNRLGTNNSISTTLINKMRPPKGTVNLERSQEICRTAIAKSPNWVQLDPNVVGSTLQQIGSGQGTSKMIQPHTSNPSSGQTSVSSIIINPSTTNNSNVSAAGLGGPAPRPSLGNVVPISIRPSISNASGSVQIMALPSTTGSSIPTSGLRGTAISSAPTAGGFTNAVIVNAINNTVRKCPLISFFKFRQKSNKTTCCGIH